VVVVVVLLEVAGLPGEIEILVRARTGRSWSCAFSEGKPSELVPIGSACGSAWSSGPAAETVRAVKGIRTSQKRAFLARAQGFPP
jgi:hypothetical protein